MSLEDILKLGNWSNKLTWQKHYTKFTSNESAQFQESIELVHFELWIMINWYNEFAVLLQEVGRTQH